MKMLVITGKIALSIFLLYLLNIALTIAVLLIGSVISGLALTSAVHHPMISKTMMLVAATVSIIVVWILYQAFDKHTRLSLGLRHTDRSNAIIEGFIWGILIMTVSFLSIWVLGGLRVLGIGVGTHVLSGLVFAVLLFALVAIGEELLCRGYWYGLLEREYGRITATILTAILFAGLHLQNPAVLQNPVPLVNLLLGGILLGVARAAGSGLWLPMGIHFTWNLFQGNIYGFAVSGVQFRDSLVRITANGHPLISGSSFGAEGSIVTGFVLLFFTFLIHVRYNKLPKII